MWLEHRVSAGRSDDQRQAHSLLGGDRVAAPTKLNKAVAAARLVAVVALLVVEWLQHLVAANVSYRSNTQSAYGFLAEVASAIVRVLDQTIISAAVATLHIAIIASLSNLDGSIATNRILPIAVV